MGCVSLDHFTNYNQIISNIVNNINSYKTSKNTYNTKGFCIKPLKNYSSFIVYPVNADEFWRRNPNLKNEQHWVLQVDMVCKI